MNPRQVIAERFVIERLVGSGGMGSVYKAHDRLSGSPVAIKFLSGSLVRDQDRFQREAQLLAEIRDPRIVRYVAHGLTAADQPYIAMEWFEGEDLADRLARTGLTTTESVLLAKRVAEALGSLHGRGIIHRDIKPANLFLPDGAIENVKILDLGIARFADSMRVSTRTGTMVGTPGYMAPEQARGSRGVDARADVFALGCVVFECVTGCPAFAGDSFAAVLAKILIDDAPRLREMRADIPESLDDLVARMLAKHPAVRPADGGAVARELARVTVTSLAEDGPRPTASREVRALTGGERRLVSVVMAIPRTEVEPPASMSDAKTLDASHDRLYAVVAPFGAHLECLADGSVVVTVMGRRTATDQVAHAARCALALRDHLPGAPMALATGLAITTERFLAGEVIDRAAGLVGRVDDSQYGRLASASDDETSLPVRLDETTAGLLDQRFDIGGDDNGLALFGLRPASGAARTLLGKATPFVGRARELEALLAIFAEAAAEPIARAVLITAGAGFGKSRLLQEFVHNVSSRFEIAEVWTARGDSMSEGSPFSMLGQLIRNTAGILEGEPPVVRRQKLRVRLGRHLDGERLMRAAEFLGELAGIPFADEDSVQLRSARRDAMLMGDQMRLAWEGWLEAECAHGPLLIALEDLHWGDLPSVRFVESALRNLQEVPLLVVAVARPEVHDVFPQLWSERGVQEVRLGPLTRRAGESLVHEALGDDIDRGAVEGLVERAAGNAFYLEELIRAVAEGRGEALPETVLAMVEARLERLDPEARRVLRAASVYGEMFWRSGLIALLGGERKTSEVDEWLEDLVGREVIDRHANAKFAGEREYAFCHALVREAAYAMLTSEDRALGHRLAGEWLERVGENEGVVLAEHFERGKAPARAVEWYGRAAAQALGGNDFDAAIDRAEHAVACGATGAALGRLRLHEAEACNWQGNRREAEAYGLSAVRALPRGSAEWFLAGAETALASFRLGHTERLLELANEFRSFSEEPPASAGRCIGTARLASRLYMAGLVDVADDLLSEMRNSVGDLVDREPSVAGWLLHAQSLQATVAGQIETEISLLERAVQSFVESGDVRNECVNRQNLAVGLTQFGVFDAAEHHLRHVLQVAERLGLRAIALSAKQNLGTVLGRSDRFEEAMPVLREAVKGFAALGDAVMEAASRAYLAMVLRTMGAHEEAYLEASAAAEGVRSIPSLRAAGLGIVTFIEIDRGHAQAALEAATLAMELLHEIGTVIEGEAVIRLAYAEALHASGQTDAATVAIKAARDRLLTRADTIQNPAWRRSFLERIRENARTLARAGEWVR